MRLIIVAFVSLLAVDNDYLKARIAIALNQKHATKQQPKQLSNQPAKRLLICYTTPGCEPCQRFKKDVNAGQFEAFNVVMKNHDDAPFEIDRVPCFHWNHPSGKGRRFPTKTTPDSEAGYRDPQWLKSIIERDDKS